MLAKIMVCLIAGAGAGFGTGLAGLSAAAVIAPMLITFLHVNAYEAVGIALASDVLASAISAYTYKKNKNIDIKNGLIMLVSVLLFTLVGSYIASLLPQNTMGSFSMFMTLLGYELKTAVGTSVFIMTFTALTGALSHFAIGDGITDYSILVLCIVFTLIGAMLTSKFANRASPKVMNRTLGFGLAAMSIAMIIINYI